MHPMCIPACICMQVKSHVLHTCMEGLDWRHRCRPGYDLACTLLLPRWFSPLFTVGSGLDNLDRRQDRRGRVAVWRRALLGAHRPPIGNAQHPSEAGFHQAATVRMICVDWLQLQGRRAHECQQHSPSALCCDLWHRRGAGLPPGCLPCITCYWVLLLSPDAQKRCGIVRGRRRRSGHWGRYGKYVWDHMSADGCVQLSGWELQPSGCMHTAERMSVFS
eukprot:352473-Chlamydomonas_euryale.AAC.19